MKISVLLGGVGMLIVKINAFVVPFYRLTVHGTDLSESAGEAVAALRDKLVWATEQLSATNSIHEAQNVAGLITETCKAITALKEL